jgi:hypothetical protein
MPGMAIDSSKIATQIVRQDIGFDAIREAASVAQRIPVRIPIDKAPASVVLAAGMTAAVQIDDARRSPTK